MNNKSFRFQVSSFKLKRCAGRSADARFSNIKLETRNLKQRSERRARSRGFTLVEMVTVIAITAVVAAATAVFLRLPLQAYQDAQRRAAITDTADTAFTRIKRDLQSSLPNSVRVTNVGQVYYLEFLQMRTGGRYRSQLSSTPAHVCDAVAGDAQGDVLAFGVSDTCFTTLGDIPNRASVVNTDFLVVYNLGTGFSNADAYAVGTATTGNKSQISSVDAGVGGENVVKFAGHQFTLDSPGRRFQIIAGPVSYVCDPGAGTLTRISGYGISAAQPAPPAGATVRLAQGIDPTNGCTITYSQNVINQRVGIVSIRLAFFDTTSATKVSLFEEIQVSNVP